MWVDSAGNARERHFPGAPFLWRVDWGLKRAELDGPFAVGRGCVAADAAHLRTAGAGRSQPVLQHQAAEREHLQLGHGSHGLQVPGHGPRLSDLVLDCGQRGRLAPRRYRAATGPQRAQPGAGRLPPQHLYGRAHPAHAMVGRLPGCP